MAPIRVGIVGLSSKASGTLVPGVWARVAHLGTFSSSTDFAVVAVVGSSLEAARIAIEISDLPQTTRAYASVAELASDPDVDMVVVSVRVEKHFELTKPVLMANKQEFVEWPLAANLAEAETLTRLAAQSGRKHIVGLQARSDALVLKIKELVGAGKIGRVVSATVVASSALLSNAAWPQGAEYYLDMNSGGNEFFIYFGHCKFALCSSQFPCDVEQS